MAIDVAGSAPSADGSGNDAAIAAPAETLNAEDMAVIANAFD